LQDTSEFQAFQSWRVEEARPTAPAIVYRDVVVLDTDNRAVAVYNLTDYNLAIRANYDRLKMILRTATTR
jgi:hypothetical protein